MLLRVAVTGVVLLLTGCISTPGKPMPDAQCRQAAYDDPQVVNRRSINAGISANGLAREDRDQLDYLQNDAYTRCMRLRGLAPPGGVEAVRPQR